jgi:protein arginine N-methyltransferase 1
MTVLSTAVSINSSSVPKYRLPREQTKMFIKLLLLSLLISATALVSSTTPSTLSGIAQEALVALDGGSVIDSENDVVFGNIPKEANEKVYFLPYGTMYEHKRMLSDRVRMNAYHSAIMNNKDYFKDKIVLDVGAGSGVLSIWAAKAGAKHVYACEATSMANHARSMVAANNESHRVTVIQSIVEKLSLPLPNEGRDQVDIIISEWMGMALLRESMLDSVLFARDKFLRKDGSLWPSHVSIYVGLVKAQEAWATAHDGLLDEMEDWDAFSQDMADYELDTQSMRETYETESRHHFLGHSSWQIMDGSDVIGEASMVWTRDLNTVTAADAAEVRNATFAIDIPHLYRHSISKTQTETRRLRNLDVHGLLTWFTCDFSGNAAHPLNISTVELSTGPKMGYTHWGQQLSLFNTAEPMVVNAGDVLAGQFSLTRRADNHRMYSIENGVALVQEETKTPFAIEEAQRQVGQEMHIYHVP